MRTCLSLLSLLALACNAKETQSSAAFADAVVPPSPYTYYCSSDDDERNAFLLNATTSELRISTLQTVTYTLSIEQPDSGHIRYEGHFGNETAVEFLDRAAATGADSVTLLEAWIARSPVTYSCKKIGSDTIALWNRAASCNAEITHLVGKKLLADMAPEGRFESDGDSTLILNGDKVGIVVYLQDYQGQDDAEWPGHDVYLATLKNADSCAVDNIELIETFM